MKCEHAASYDQLLPCLCLSVSVACCLACRHWRPHRPSSSCLVPALPCHSWQRRQHQPPTLLETQPWQMRLAGARAPARSVVTTTCWTWLQTTTRPRSPVLQGKVGMQPLPPCALGRPYTSACFSAAFAAGCMDEPTAKCTLYFHVLDASQTAGSECSADMGVLHMWCRSRSASSSRHGHRRSGCSGAQ